MTGKSVRRTNTTAKNEPRLPESVVRTLYAQREWIFVIHGIVSCARYASDSMLSGKPNLGCGLKGAEKLLEDVAEALEEFVSGFDPEGCDSAACDAARENKRGLR